MTYQVAPALRLLRQVIREINVRNEVSDVYDGMGGNGFMRGYVYFIMVGDLRWYGCYGPFKSL